jgi:acetyl esterase/lipase
VSAKYRVIRDAGGKAELDLYKGVPHVFQAMGAGTPESNTAMSEAKSFFDLHLQARR